MTLAAGSKLGPYEITVAVGAGGMGEVCEARDTKLGRNVAIKVLPEAFEHDAGRLARFQREAKMLAALNHPNIATIYGPEQTIGTSYLVMELVTGETLAERVKREGAVPIEETLKIGAQIAEDQAIPAIAADYSLLTGGETLGINDMSLVWGGPFDICGDWLEPHRAHRAGKSADVGKQTLDSFGQPAPTNKLLLDGIARAWSLTRICEGTQIIAPVPACIGGPLHYESPI